MTDPVPDSKPSTRWFWVGALVLLAVVLIIFVFNADGDEDDFTVTDADITTTEERLNTDLDATDMDEAAEQVNGAEAGDTAEPMMTTPTEGE
ncbi:hypothetical protein [Altererythrobacter sp. MTPC7]|uniref:hypothetical protein n=1 Tax=Altererythrobacter sp. MTPC7 TaxID=3056567 RepID=UPI0036F211B5